MSSSHSITGVVNGDLLALKAGFSALYDSKDVRASSVTVSDMDINNPNYKLEISSFTIQGQIIPKDLKVKADAKEITYGDAAPTYSVTYEGFATGESETDLVGAIQTACEYDENDPTKRGAKDYIITPSGWTNPNYNIIYENGVLKVNKAVLSITAENKEFVYREDSALPTYTGQWTGFKYGETQDVITNVSKVSYSCDAEMASVAGDYPITPDLPTDIDELSAANYTFLPVAGSLTVIRNEITITGITVKEKKYDGTTDVATENIEIASVQYGGIKPEDDRLENKGITVTAQYEDGNVGNGKIVKLEVTLNEYLGARYHISDTSQKEATANITEQILKVTADPKTIRYGDAPPEYTVSYEGFVGGETSAVLGGTLEFDASYVAGDDVGTSYPITPKGYSSTNYDIQYAPGSLTVEQTKLTPPQPVWSAVTPGLVEWGTVPQIGNVSVTNYKLELYQAGNPTPIVTQTLEGNVTNYDLKEIIRNHGLGAYTVKVSAIADKNTAVNNGNKNVTDSEAGVSAPIYAAQVSVEFNADAISAAGGKDQAATIQGQNTYVVLAGERELSVAATVLNATGYTVKSCTSASPAVTFTEGKQEDKNYTAKAAVGTVLASAQDIQIILTLEATKATLDLNIGADKGEVDYGYTEVDAPKLTVTATAALDDNIPTAEYTYAYQWKLQSGFDTIDIAGAKGEKLVFPLGQIAGTYTLSCQVTATRKDNGQSADKSSGGYVIKVKQSAFQSDVSLDNWTYGEARKSPEVSKNLGGSKVTYEYSTDGITWIQAMPTDAGTYWLKAIIAAAGNYQEVRTDPKKFTIAKERLPAPTGLQMMPSGTAPYGKATWVQVDGIEENEGIDPASDVKVTYVVKLYRAEKEGENSVFVKEYSPVTACEYDFTSDIGNTGIYTYTVTAMSNNTTNCANSPESIACEPLKVSGNIKAEEDLFEKTYDGKGIKLTAEFEYTGGSTPVYQWYRNDVPIAGANNVNYTVNYVEQSGSYSCAITVDSVHNSSTHEQVTITRRDTV